MGAFKTLGELQTATKRKEKSKDNLTPRYFSLKDGESFRIRFRQELAEDGSLFSDEVGTAEIVPVHTNPSDFRKSGVCTANDPEYGYKCWACEQIAGTEEGYKWKPKPHLVVNVAVLMTDESGKQTWEPRILDQKFSAQHIGSDVVEFASMNGSIMDRDYMFKRTGSGTDTQYKLLPLDAGDPDSSIADLEMHDVTSIYHAVPYAEQPGRYLGSDNDSGSGGW